MSSNFWGEVLAAVVVGVAAGFGQPEFWALFAKGFATTIVLQTVSKALPAEPPA